MEKSSNSPSRLLLSSRAEKVEDFTKRHLGLALVFCAILAVLKAGPIPAFGWGPSDSGSLPLIPRDNRPWQTMLTRSFTDKTREALQEPGLVLVSFALCAICMISLASLVVRRFARSETLVAYGFIVLGPVGLVLITEAGSLDGIFLLGAAILTLGNTDRMWLILGAVLLMVYSNPGQSVLAAISLLALTAVPIFRHLRQRALIVLTGGLGLSLIEVMAFSASSQGHLLTDLAGQSLSFSFLTLPLRVLTLYGLLWALVIAFIFAMSRKTLLPALLGFVAIPICSMLFTLDGTRVGVGVSSLAFFALLTVTIPRLVSFLRECRIPTIAALVAIAVVPMPYVYMNSIEVPWVFLANLI